MILSEFDGLLNVSIIQELPPRRELWTDKLAIEPGNKKLTLGHGGQNLPNCGFTKRRFDCVGFTGTAIIG